MDRRTAARDELVRLLAERLVRDALAGRLGERAMIPDESPAGTPDLATRHRDARPDLRPV